jgi:hypothetical protein
VHQHDEHEYHYAPMSVSARAAAPARG